MRNDERVVLGHGQAFSLIELLVTISVVAILLGTLLPVLTQARQISRSAVCLSNIRQIGVFSGVYFNDHKDFVWPVYNSQYNAVSGGTDVATDYTSFQSLLGRLYISGSYFSQPDEVSPWNVERRQTTSWTVNPIFYCPQMELTQAIAGLGVGKYNYVAGVDNARTETNAEFSYAANWTGAKQYDRLPSDTTVWRRVSDYALDTYLLSEPVYEGVPYIDDSLPDGAGTPSYPMDSLNSTNGGRRPMAQARINWWRHQGAVFAFIDGSAKVAKWGEVKRAARTPDKD